ncbi:MAG TPA: helix-turn-helix domain-containing protein [Polyangiaceae bacterium]|nr:helix-turn-helix domain-containing protein [Polyangiaceae bacterium]
MHLRTPKDIGALIRQRRRELRLNQRALAQRAGVSRQWLIECERGKPRAALALVLRTLAALGLELQPEKRAAPKATARDPEAPDIDAIVRNARKPRR